MKKIIALALALTMVFSMALSVSAKETYTEETPDTFTGYTSNGVNVVITMSGLNVVHTYAFDIEYGAMEFNYGKVMTWNPETYKYEASGDGGDWNANGTNKIKVVNHSDMPIVCEATASVNAAAAGEFVLAVTEGKQIEGCTVTTEPNSLFHEMTVTLSGEPHISSADKVVIGQVSVTISKEAPANNDTTVEEQQPTVEPTANAQ